MPQSEVIRAMFSEDSPCCANAAGKSRLPVPMAVHPAEGGGWRSAAAAASGMGPHHTQLLRRHLQHRETVLRARLVHRTRAGRPDQPASLPWVRLCPPRMRFQDTIRPVAELTLWNRARGGRMARSQGSDQRDDQPCLIYLHAISLVAQTHQCCGSENGSLPGFGAGPHNMDYPRTRWP